MFPVLRRPLTDAAWLPELIACVALSWPLVLTNAIEMAMNLTGVAMIGRIGPEALAAATLGLAFYNLFLLFGIGVTGVVASLVAREIGHGRNDAAVRRIVQQGFWGAALITGPMLMLLWNAEPLLLALGEDPLLSSAAGRYLHALQWTMLPALVYLVLRSFLAALGRPRWAVLAGGAAVVLNAALNWLLIGGHGGFPALGLFGSGLATLASNLFMAMALGLMVALHPRTRSLRLFAGLFRPSWTGFGAFWRLGLPIGVSLLLEVGMFTAAAAVVGRINAASLAAHAIALQVASLTFMVPLGLAQAATIRIGRALGAGNAVAITRAGWTALSLGVAVMAVSAVVLITVPRAIIGLFLDSGEPGVPLVEAIAVPLLGIAGLFQVADGAQVVLAGMLRGLQDTRAPMVVAAIGYWGVGLPVGIVLAFALHLQAAGVWIGMTIGLFTVAILLLGRWRRLLRRPALPARAG